MKQQARHDGVTGCRGEGVTQRPFTPSPTQSLSPPACVRRNPGAGFSANRLRGGAVAACRAHNPEVVGSNPTPAIAGSTSRDSRDSGDGPTSLHLPADLPTSPPASHQSHHGVTESTEKGRLGEWVNGCLRCLTPSPRHHLTPSVRESLRVLCGSVVNGSPLKPGAIAWAKRRRAHDVAVGVFIRVAWAALGFGAAWIVM